MKNVHVIKSDKPSRLSIIDSQLIFSKEYYVNPQNIYITSSEAIKEGDWYYIPRTNFVYKCKENPAELNAERAVGISKIILTTDQDLIKGGVQAIDDEFLKWFVKNPSCEEVEVNSETMLVGWEPDYSFEDEGIEGSKGVYQTFYKIIIPKQERKQQCKHEFVSKYGVTECQNCGIEESDVVSIKKDFKIDLTKLCCYDRRNPDFSIKEEYGYDKEEIDATGNFAKKDCYCDNCFYGRAKLTEQLIYLAETMYTEEDLIEAFTDGIYNVDYNETQGWSYKLTEEEWFKQFKKK